MEKKILIVDDDEMLLKMFERMFVAQEFEVVKAVEGADALAKLYMMDKVPTVVLLDIMIPVLSGIEVLALMKKSNKLKNVPVVILSNLTPEKATESDILALGATKYLHKSDYTPEQIVAKVLQVIAETARV